MYVTSEKDYGLFYYTVKDYSLCIFAIVSSSVMCASFFLCFFFVVTETSIICKKIEILYVEKIKFIRLN